MTIAETTKARLAPEALAPGTSAPEALAQASTTRTARSGVSLTQASLTCLPLAALLTGHVALAEDAPGTILASAADAIIFSHGTLGPVASITLPTYHANFGVAEQTIAVALSNIGIAGAAEGLDISPGTLSAVTQGEFESGRFLLRLRANGTVTNLAAGATIANGLTVIARDVQVGGDLHAQLTLRVSSNGETTSRNGLTRLPDGKLLINATVIPFARPMLSVGNAFDLGSFRAGGTVVTRDITVTNGAPVIKNGDILVATSIATLGTGFTATSNMVGGLVGAPNPIPVTLAPGASTAKGISVSFDTKTEGTYNGSILMNFLSDGSPSGNGRVPVEANVLVPLPTAGVSTIALSGTVVGLAKAVTNTSSIALVGRVGGPQPVGQIFVTNQSTSAVTEFLVPQITSKPNGIVVQGGAGAILAGSTGAAAVISASPNFSVNVNGTIGLTYTSVGLPGEQDAAPVTVGTADIPISVKNYQAATPSFAPTLNLGVVHVGDKVKQVGLPIANTGTAPLMDSLQAQLLVVNGPYVPGGTATPPAGIAAGASSSAITFGMATDHAGILNTGTAVIGFTSHNPDMADQVLANGTVLVSGQVNQHATMGLANPTAGKLEQSGNAYTLHLGTVKPVNGAIDIAIDVLNTVSGVADDLWVTALSDLNELQPQYILNGVAQLAPGARAAGGLRLILDAAEPGAFSHHYALQARETNWTGYSAPLLSGPLRLTIDGVVAPVPEPWSITLTLSGLALMAGARRRRPRPSGG